MSTVTSPNMGLPVPVVGQEPGPQWATDLNNCMAVIDAHSHTPGSGVAITPAALNINADLPLNTNNITQARTLRFSPQSATLSLASDIGCLYEVTNDLWYNDGAGNQVRLTQSGSIVGSAGSITGLPSGTAGASYSGVSSTFVWQSATGIAANMDFGSATFRNLSPNSTFGATLSAPAGLGSNYALTLPALPISTRVMSLDSSGNMAAGVAGVVITADIGNQQVTTATIADGNVTPAKLSANTSATSATVVTFTTTNNSYPGALITGMAATITATGVRPVLIKCEGEHAVPFGINTGGRFSGTASIVSLYRNGVLIGANSSGSTSPASAMSFTDFPPAGSAVYQIYLFSLNGTSEGCVSTFLRVIEL